MYILANATCLTLKSDPLVESILDLLVRWYIEVRLKGARRVTCDKPARTLQFSHSFLFVCVFHSSCLHLSHVMRMLKVPKDVCFGKRQPRSEEENWPSSVI